MQNLKIIRTVNGLTELRDYINGKDFLSFDTETTGVDRGSSIIGFSVCGDTDTSYYVIVSYWDVSHNKLVDLETKEHAKGIIQLLVGKSLIMHNAIFDCSMVEVNYGIRLIESVHTDTMILAHLLDENRRNGLKELGTSIFGDDAKHEQTVMKESVIKNGGKLTKDCYELYKADADLIAKYGAKDTLLTFQLFYVLLDQLYEEGLDKFFYDEESMPLLRGPTYELNTSGLRVDSEKLQDLKRNIETDLIEMEGFIYKEITPYISEQYPGTKKTNTFNISSPTQLSWLLFIKLENPFGTLTDSGKDLCKAFNIKVPYTNAAKRDFIRFCNDNLGMPWREKSKIRNPWMYMSSDEEVLRKIAPRYKWLQRLLEHKKQTKILSVYVEGIQSRMIYNIIRPSFLQHGTTSGRYSSRDPNFQNLPRSDKRIKQCIISRPGKVFVGADYAQLEPRVFASTSQDPRLMECFEKGEDFYSVVGAPIFEKTNCSMFADDANSFKKLFPELRDDSKAFALATPYGTSAYQQSQKLDRTPDECQTLIDRYFQAYPRVELMMLQSHEQIKSTGVAYSLFGRPRRVPKAMEIPLIYGSIEHGKLPYSARTLLNLSVNHRIQSSAASVVNRASISLYNKIRNQKLDANIVLQVHDEIVVECKIEDSQKISLILKECLEKTTILPGVNLIAEPKTATNLGDLK